MRGRTFDVRVETHIAAAPVRVAELMLDPRREPQWMKAVATVEPLDGGRVRRSGRFLGRTLRWTTEAIESRPPALLRLRIVDGPMRGEVEYRIEPRAQGSLVSIRNIGEVPAFAPRWLVAAAVRKATKADLARLKELAEGAGS
jgi:uncharacterized membrane protein